MVLTGLWTDFQVFLVKLIVNEYLKSHMYNVISWLLFLTMRKGKNS